MAGLFSLTSVLCVARHWIWNCISALILILLAFAALCENKRKMTAEPVSVTSGTGWLQPSCHLELQSSGQLHPFPQPCFVLGPSLYREDTEAEKAGVCFALTHCFLKELEPGVFLRVLGI